MRGEQRMAAGVPASPTLFSQSTPALRESPMAAHLPSVELLQATHQFPCVYAFKAIGLSTDCFIGRVLAAVKLELNEDAEPAFSTRSTAGGKHTSVTVEPEVASAVHVIAIYHRIHAIEGIVMVM